MPVNIWDLHLSSSLRSPYPQPSAPLQRYINVPPLHWETSTTGCELPQLFPPFPHKPAPLPPQSATSRLEERGIFPLLPGSRLTCVVTVFVFPPRSLKARFHYLSLSLVDRKSHPPPTSFPSPPLLSWPPPSPPPRASLRVSYPDRPPQRWCIYTCNFHFPTFAFSPPTPPRPIAPAPTLLRKHAWGAI